jgi:hypothetical protein
VVAAGEPTVLVVGGVGVCCGRQYDVGVGRAWW